MNRTIPLLVLTTIVVPLFLGCQDDQQSQERGSTVSTYTIDIKGTSGLEVEVLLISKPTAKSIQREQMSITVPFTKSFRAVNCVVWVDHEFRGKENPYHVGLSRDGQPLGLLEMVVNEGNIGSGSIGML